MEKISGGEVIAKQLEKNEVEYVFSLTGHSILALYDAIRKSNIKLISVRHEQIAAHMADGYFRASHKPGIVVTHLGPGLLNAATGVATAALDSSAIIVISGDAPSIYEGAGPHQEINLVTDLSQYLIYLPFVKRTWRVSHVENLERIIDRAFSISLNMRPGPVLVSVPMEIFSQKTDKYGIFNKKHYLNMNRIVPSIEKIKQAIDMILNSEKVLILAGGGVRLSEAEKELYEFAHIINAPVVTTMGGKGTFPEDDPLSLGYLGGWGNPYSNEASLKSDLIISIGTRFGEVNSRSWINGYTFDFSKTKLIRIDIDEKEESKNYPEDIFLLGDAKETLKLLIYELNKEELNRKIIKKSAWFQEFRENLDKYYLEFLKTENDAKKLKPNYIIKVVQELLNKHEEITMVTDVGWSKNGIAQYLRIKNVKNFIAPGGLATMGFAPPASLGFKLGDPNRKVLCIVGDGGFSSTISSLFTAVQYKIPVTFLIMNNFSFGTIQGLQRSYFSGNYIGTAFTGFNEFPYNPDFAKIAEASHAKGYTVKSPEDLSKTIEDSLMNDEIAVIDVMTELEPDVPITGHWSITDIYMGKIKYMFDRR
ncbi:MAG: thiamine pyrophosphate-binding protein [Thermoproteota archaeon]